MWEDVDCAILVGSLPDDLVPAIFGPLPFFDTGNERALVRLPDTATMHDVAFEAGLFPSKSKARKQWSGKVEIPFGSQLMTIGKSNSKRIFIHRATGEN